MATQKAIAFAYRARDMAATLELVYRKSKRITQQWLAMDMATDIPASNAVLEDGNETQPLTYADVRKILDRANEIVGDMEGADAAKFSAILRASSLPGDWR